MKPWKFWHFYIATFNATVSLTHEKRAALFCNFIRYKTYSVASAVKKKSSYRIIYAWDG